LCGVLSGRIWHVLFHAALANFTRVPKKTRNSSSETRKKKLVVSNMQGVTYITPCPKNRKSNLKMPKMPRGERISED
jgi:hypothetical protein